VSSSSSDAPAGDAGHAGVLQTLRETPVAARFALLGVFVNQFGAFLQFFIVLYLTRRGFSAEEAGFALGAYSVGAIAGTLFGGSFSDRLGPRWTIVLSMGTAALFTVTVVALDNIVGIVIVVALAGALTQAARPAVSALLFSMVPEARQVMTFAMYRTALNAGSIAGPLVAVWLSTISWNLVFYFDAATTLIYCAIAAFLIPREDATKAAAAGATDATPPSYLTVLRDHRYLAYLAIMLANGLVHVQYFAVLPLQLDGSGYPPWAYGTATAVSATIVVGCELLVTRTTQTWPAWIAVIAGWILLVVGRGAFGLPGGFTVILIATILAAIGQVIGGPAAFAYPAKAAPPGAMGRYIGSAHATFGLGYAIGPVLGVLLWTRLGDGFWAVVLAFGLLMIAPGVWGMRPRGERAVAETAPAAAG
jgi:MFS family permease